MKFSDDFIEWMQFLAAAVLAFVVVVAAVAIVFPASAVGSVAETQYDVLFVIHNLHIFLQRDPHRSGPHA